MKKESKFEAIKTRITSSHFGSIFVASDFTDIAQAETVNTTLARLAQEGVLRRIKWGLYEFPEYNDFLGEYVAPSSDAIAHAIARSFDWEIAPSGENALNQMGLSTQVPATLTYACNGAYREYQVGKTKIKFKKASNRDFAGGNEKAALVIQALKALGKKNVNENTLTRIGFLFSTEEFNCIMKETQHATAWIGACIRAAYQRSIQNEKNCKTA